MGTDIHEPHPLNIYLACKDAREIVERNSKLNEDSNTEYESSKVWKCQAEHKTFSSKNESQIGISKYRYVHIF